MEFKFNIWPIYGFLLGFNYAATTFIEEEVKQHELQFGLGLFIVEIVWES